MTATISVPWLDEAIEELERDFPSAGDVEPEPPSWDNPPWNPTEVTIRIRDYVTREFNEGAAGNRQRLPSTYDVAKACIRGAGNTKSCRLAMRHLRLLELVGEIIRIHDPESLEEFGTSARHFTFWALPDSGLQIPVAVTVSGLDSPVNKYGFTDEKWAAMKPYQRNLIRSIELADTEPSSRG